MQYEVFTYFTTKAWLLAGGNLLVLACKIEIDFRDFFFFEEFLSCLWEVEIRVDCLFLILISLYFGFSVNFVYIVNCYYWIFGSKLIGLYFLCDFGGYLDDDLAILFGIVFTYLECDQPEINSIVAGCTEYLSFCLGISFDIFHCSVNTKLIILWQFLWQFFYIF